MQTTCPGCSCLCDDIVFEDGKVRNACRRGAGIFLNRLRGRAENLIEGKSSEIEEVIEKAGEIITDSENLVIYGLDTITIEAQKLAIKLAEKLDAFIDDNSSFCLGNFVEACLKKKVPTTTLDYVRDNAYVIIYWGVNPFHSLPRHMSRYSYFPRGKNRQRGYEEDRFLVVIDVRRNHTSKLVRSNGIFIEVDSDLELISSFEDVMRGKASKYMNEVAGILREIKKGEAVIFGGLGLKYGLLDSGYGGFYSLVNKLNEFSKVYFIPAGFHPNMRGFNEILFEKTGCVNRYSFAERKSDASFEFRKLIERDAVDTAVIIGSDPVNSLPFEISKKLAKIKTVLIDPRKTFTSRIADVTIRCAISGVETGGSMRRSDGVEVELKQIFNEEIDDCYILKKLLEMV